MTTRAPFARGSISLGLHPAAGDPTAAVEILLDQAIRAENSGFDGVTLAEHHAGHPGYLPTPLLGASWILGATESIWAAAAPMLLPIRPAGLVVEEATWLSARHPGRVAVGFAPGYVEDDFRVAAASFEDRRKNFWPALRSVTRTLSTGEASSPLDQDPAVARCAEAPIPVVAAVSGPVGVRRAAQAGAGILLGAFASIADTRALIDAYAEAGGSGPRVLIRRIWIGEPPAGAVEQMIATYSRHGDSSSFLGDKGSSSVIFSPHTDEVVERLCAAAIQVGADALNLRLVMPGVGESATTDQIELAGREVVAPVRAALLATTG
ncbi:LLM class flavin-dependent oxidoreductase [Rhodococcus sp. WS4]|nr:LLM class flavin-dependent oxidoreductase [Rhodococcus sp. WS4]